VKIEFLFFWIDARWLDVNVSEDRATSIFNLEEGDALYLYTDSIYIKFSGHNFRVSHHYHVEL